MVSLVTAVPLRPSGLARCSQEHSYLNFVTEVTLKWWLMLIGSDF